MGKGLDLVELIINSKDIDWSKETDMANEVSKKVKFVLKHYNELIMKIDTNVSKTISLVNLQINYICSELEK